MKKVTTFFLGTAFLILTCIASPLSVDDFLPPARGGPSSVEGNVSRTSVNEVKAENIQDGLNYGNKLIWEEQGGNGFMKVDFPSGVGYIAGAIASYSVYPNINATLLGKRSAYLEAYFKAKANMLQGLEGYYTEREEEFLQLMIAIDTEDQNVGASLNARNETIRQGVNGLLRGYITYEVLDQPGQDRGQVYVSIAITPRTLNAINQVTNGIIFSRDTRTSLELILSDIINGIVPPVGAKLSIVPDTGEVAIVAYGSAIVRHSQNPRLAQEYKTAAVEASRMRATQTLVEVLNGNTMAWYSGIYEGVYSLDASAEYVTIYEQVQDLPYEDNRTKRLVAQASQNEFANIFVRTSEYKSTSQGVVPPGVIIRTAFDPSVETDGYGWVYAIAVYYPPFSLDAENFNKRLQNLFDEDASSGVTRVVLPGLENPNPQGPSGQVSDDGEL